MTWRIQKSTVVSQTEMRSQFHALIIPMRQSSDDDTSRVDWLSKCLFATLNKPNPSLAFEQISVAKPQQC